MARDNDYRFSTPGNRAGKSIATGRPGQQLRSEHGGLITKGQAEFSYHMEFAKKLKRLFTVKELVAAGISRSAAYSYRGPYAFPNEKNRMILQQLVEEKERCLSMITTANPART